MAASLSLSPGQTRRLYHKILYETERRQKADKLPEQFSVTGIQPKGPGSKISSASSPASVPERLQSSAARVEGLRVRGVRLPVVSRHDPGPR